MKRSIAKHMAEARVWTGEELLRVVGYAKKRVGFELSRVNRSISRRAALELQESALSPTTLYDGASRAHCLMVTNILREAVEGLVALLPDEERGSNLAEYEQGADSQSELEGVYGALLTEINSEPCMGGAGDSYESMEIPGDCPCRTCSLHRISDQLWQTIQAHSSARAKLQADLRLVEDDITMARRDVRELFERVCRRDAEVSQPAR